MNENKKMAVNTTEYANTEDVKATHTDYNGNPLYEYNDYRECDGEYFNVEDCFEFMQYLKVKHGSYDQVVKSVAGLGTLLDLLVTWGIDNL